VDTQAKSAALSISPAPLGEQDVARTNNTASAGSIGNAGLRALFALLATGDEDRKPIHEDCYTQCLLSSLHDPPSPHHAE
jgi:hypothetical protein